MVSNDAFTVLISLNISPTFERCSVVTDVTIDPLDEFCSIPDSIDSLSKTALEGASASPESSMLVLLSICSSSLGIVFGGSFPDSRRNTSGHDVSSTFFVEFLRDCTLLG